MPQKDWETINDDWAEHDLRGAQRGDDIPGTLAPATATSRNLADFARKAQLKTTRPSARCTKAATQDFHPSPASSPG